MPSEARQKKIMEKLNRAQKCSILGPKNLGSGGAPGAPPGYAPANKDFTYIFDLSLSSGSPLRTGIVCCVGSPVRLFWTSGDA